MKTFSTIGVLALAVCAGPAMGGWIAYNDLAGTNGVNVQGQTTVAAYTGAGAAGFGWSGNPLAARVTPYGLPVEGVSSGTLIDYATGNSLADTVTITATNLEAESYTGQNQGPIGSDANNRFGGIVNLVGTTTYSVTGSWFQQIAFTNLDPTARYSFFGHGFRGATGTRTCFVELLGADASTGAASSGIYATISPTEYEYNTRGNNTGLLVGWTGINPGSDGSFTIYVNDGSVNGTTAYGLGAFQLISQQALIWNTTSGTWNTTASNWTVSGGGSFSFLDGDSVTFSGTDGGVVTLSGTMQPSAITVSATSGTYTFVSSGTNLISGTTGLAKSGGGTLILSGSNGFTGTTSITGGSLLVNGVLSSTTTTVSGGLLGGSGTVSNAVQFVAAGGTIAPGAAPGGIGVLTLGSVSGTGGTFAMDITGTGAGQYDRIVVGGNLNYTGNTLQLTFTGGTYTNGSSWDLFDFMTQSGTLGAISPIVADSAYNGLAWGLAANGNFYDQKYGDGVWLSDWTAGGQRFIFNQGDGVLTVVPEPSTFVMAAAGIAGWGLFRYRRRRSLAAAAAAESPPFA